MNLEAGEGNLVLGAADLDLLNVKRTAHVHDGVKGAGEGPGIDNVSFESDFFAEWGHGSFYRLQAASVAARNLCCRWFRFQLKKPAGDMPAGPR